MQSTYRVNAADLTDDFLKALKYTYKNQEIEITVNEVVDETDYLLGTEANRKQVLDALEDLETGNDLVSLPIESLPSA